jgi:hypothetical protein
VHCADDTSPSPITKEIRRRNGALFCARCSSKHAHETDAEAHAAIDSALLASFAGFFCHFVGWIIDALLIAFHGCRLGAANRIGS